MHKGILNIDSEAYPKLLRDIAKPPKKLFYIYEKPLKKEIFNRCLSIVGSREISKYGKEVLDHLFKSLNRSTTIVSGFMTGVDSYAHTLALKYEMATVAILPCGLDIVYPQTNKVLYKEILSSGNLLLSEHPFGMSPMKWTLSKRNRLIAGMSYATLVIEASINSGSLVSANYAHSFGRPVLVIPGSIFSTKSLGITYLINKYGIAVSSGEEINTLLNTYSMSLFGATGMF